MSTELIEAIDAVAEEKNISKEILYDAIEQALLAAYKKNYGTNQNVRVAFDFDKGEINVLVKKTVVADEDFDRKAENQQITLSEAREIDSRFEIGDAIEFVVKPEEFGRIAAQTAKQVLKQRISEAERTMIYNEFISRQGEIVTGTVSRRNRDTLYVNLGRTDGILPRNEQVPNEHFNVNDRLKVYIMDVKNTTKGAQIFLSRSHPGLVKRLFELEVPEIQDGIVEIAGIAREAGSRTKMAVRSNDENVDPVGACVGTRGIRVQAVVDELSGEKIDIIPWSEDIGEFIANVLSPAEVERVIIEDEEEKQSTAVVPDYQLSLAIGKQGQNVRLAAKVSGWRIDIKSHTQYFEQLAEEEAEEEAEMTAADAAEPEEASESEAFEPETAEAEAAEPETDAAEEAVPEPAAPAEEPAEDEPTE